MKKVIIFSIVIICMLFIFCSCSKTTVSFDMNGGTLNTETMEIGYNKPYSLPIPQKSGYRFVGWYNGDELIPSTGTWPYKEDCKLVAKWEFMEYEIHYDLDGGVIENRVDGFNYDSPTITISVPTKEGAIFSHWVDKKGQTYTGDYVIPTGTDTNIYLKAVWWNFEEDGVKYLYENDTLIVYKYVGKGENEIIIPNELYGKKIVKIREGAFRDLGLMVAGHETIYRIYLSENIKHIGKNAFDGCQNIKVVFNVSSNDDYIEKTKAWLETVTIEEAGNEYFKDVILRIRPTFNSSEYVQIDK